ncbi:hypothetical protein SAMN05421772_11533 [Paracoccus saliphilus]|uniref:Uncharacterized protein n=1 Tax=Paracoccus saliphilus TaxID=405559 RepID=A0AA45W719_9RHOB|nr:hypothetical protein SAMN05421772_11533 [Paracoccus saliphilus]
MGSLPIFDVLNGSGGRFRFHQHDNPMEVQMSHYTINTRSRPDLQRLALKANRERSRMLRMGLEQLTLHLHRSWRGIFSHRKQHGL